MRIFYYKLTNKANGEIVLAYFNYAETFQKLKERYESTIIRCEEITGAAYRALVGC